MAGEGGEEGGGEGGISFKGGLGRRQLQSAEVVNQSPRLQVSSSSWNFSVIGDWRKYINMLPLVTLNLDFKNFKLKALVDNMDLTTKVTINKVPALVMGGGILHLKIAYRRYRQEVKIGEKIGVRRQ